MKSLWQKIQQLEGLVDTPDVDDQTNAFLKKVAGRCHGNAGDTRWLTEKQVQWLEDIYERHFA